MRFDSLAIAGAWLVRIEPHVDERGFFARTFCANEFAAHGLPSVMVQESVSYNEKRGTLRGLHFQWAPSREAKLVRCVRGRLYDVLVDLRPTSETYLRSVGVELDADGHQAVFIPHGVAHGFLTLEDRTEVFYEMSDVFAPDLAGGFRWNDPAFGIEWPEPVRVISERDATYEAFDRAGFEARWSRGMTAAE